MLQMILKVEADRTFAMLRRAPKVATDPTCQGA